MNSNFNISNTKNFNDNFEKDDIIFIKNKFIELASEFILCTLENIVVQNVQYLLFVIQRGLETLKHCFKIIYLYTKNLELTFYHCKKAYCYYVEFIGQIGDDNNSYLQLNSKDATLFVYKKTIFDIDNEFKKKFYLEKDEKLFIQLITNIIDIFCDVVIITLYKEKNFNNNKDSICNFSLQKSTKLINKIYDNDKTVEENIYFTKTIYYFINSIKNFRISNIKFASICELFVKKFQKRKIDFEKIQEKIHRNDCTKYLNEYSALKFVNWIFQN
jgi:hypothetical protein